ncbi:RNA polymerase sigma-70 factor (ECF subfamily) [Filimonas zeae]|uniref:DNA-directed RNA polymerase sigma-70 factor n=1 Tax=Filimonas zeae TaxID=1737353 RepID=A0A917IWV7_9BACT|nr:sigma-70 family RNA polymerase sigma factor [Filimonas zeae]MDR6338970.1 RNA polymerase sigma-70 factor (ECF subfamily) [Filimonas zeae]GGH65723.1 DNA-directed RNA polymerase sigma-70 factor [Filimonas zeae]
MDSDTELDIQLDKQLLAGIAAGNADAFSRFFELHKKRVFGIAFKMTRSAESARELSQEFFLKLWEKKGDVVTVHNPGAYVYMSVYYLSIDFLRRKGNEQRVLELKKMVTRDYTNETQEWLDERQLLAYIQQAADKLTGQKKRVFEMRYVHQKSYEEIAEALKISKVSAHTYFYEALKVIRAYIDTALPGAGLLALYFILQD